MNREHFSIKSKISSSNAKSVFQLLLVALISACSSAAPPRRAPLPPQTPVEIAPLLQPPPAPLAPWEVWGTETFGDQNIADGDGQARQGKFALAIASYQQAEDNAASADIKGEALIRRLGTMLKLGRSKEVLQLVSEQMKKQQIPTEEIHPAVACLVAFSYEHENDFDQSIAWFGVAYRRSSGEVGPRALVEAKKLIAAFPDQSFETEAVKWAADSFISPLFATERARRAHGEKPLQELNAKWFRPEAYSLSPSGSSVVETDVLSPPVEETTAAQPVIGVLLPLTGSYADYGKQVKQGIDLAAEDFAATEKHIQVVYVDTTGDPAKAAEGYEQLVRDNHAEVVLGPLLAESTERVVERSRALHVPFISFTKRKGIPELGPEVFRLGATAENQVAELVHYAHESLGVSSFAIIYPETAQGEEFRSVFETAVKTQAGTLSGELSYQSASDERLAASLTDLAGRVPQALFIPDTLENIFPLLQKIRNSDLKQCVLLGPAQWDDPVAIRGGAPLLEGIIYVTPFYSESARPQVSHFVEEYRAHYQRSPDLLAAQGYDAAMLVMNLAVSAQPGPNRGFMKKLASADTRTGVTGKLQVNKVGDIERRMSVIRLVKGEKVEVMAGGEVSGFIFDETKNDSTFQR